MRPTPAQERDACLALAFLLLLAWLASPAPWLVGAALAVLAAGMIWPACFAPLARVWFGLGRLLGGFASRVLLTCLYIALVTPVGLARRLLGRDPMRLKEWKRGRASVFVTRDHPYARDDMTKPF